MKVRILSLQLLEGIQAAVRDAAGAGIGVAENFQHHGPLAVQAGVAGLGVVDDLNVSHVRQADIPEAVHMEQQSAGDILDAVVFLADLQQPALAAGILAWLFQSPAAQARGSGKCDTSMCEFSVSEIYKTTAAKTEINTNFIICIYFAQKTIRMCGIKAYNPDKSMRCIPSSAEVFFL